MQEATLSLFQMQTEQKIVQVLKFGILTASWLLQIQTELRLCQQHIF